MVNNLFSLTLRNLRKASGISIYSLSKESGISRAYLTKLERGESNPTLETLKKLSKPLGVTLLDFVQMIEGKGSYFKTNISEVEERISKDKAFYSYPLSSRSESKENEIFKFEFKSPGEHQALRPSGSVIGVYVEKGEMLFEINGEEISLKSGDYLEAKISKNYRYIQRSKKLAQGFIVIRYF